MNDLPQPFYGRRYVLLSEEQKKLANEVRKVLKNHGYSYACLSFEYDKLSISMLQDILKSWQLWDRCKAYMHI